MKYCRLALLLVATGCAGSDSRRDRRQDIDSYNPPTGAALESALASRGYHVKAYDPTKSYPQLVWTRSGATRSALGHVKEVAEAMGMRDLATLEEVGRSQIGASRLVRFRQSHGGVPILDGDIRVFSGQADDSITVIRGILCPAAWAQSRSHDTSARDAVEAIRAIVRGDPQYDGIDAGDMQSMRPKRVWFRDVARRRLIPAWVVDIVGRSVTTRRNVGHELVVDVNAGRLLRKTDLVYDNSYSFRVYADDAGRPQDGPFDFTPHPSGQPDGTQPDFESSVLVTTAGFNTNAFGQADPWLVGTTSMTTGNNVHAYTDWQLPDGIGDEDIVPTTTGPMVFDYVYDHSEGPLADHDQAKAAITNAFYVTNWLHDWYYDSGFTETAGNAQSDNYGRGGEAGDPLLVEIQNEALDGMRGVANMLTPSDGGSPRMQLGVFQGRTLRELVVEGVSYAAGHALFSPESFDVSAPVVFAEPAQACAGLANAELVAGAVVFIRRGGCDFDDKVLVAEAANAAGAVIYNDQLDDAPVPTMVGEPVGIPVLSISGVDADILRDLAGSTATMSRTTGLSTDAGLDNTVVAHEWGHYLHQRLNRCYGALFEAPPTQCLAVSEGWADFIALHMIFREEDDPAGAYPVGIYAAPAASVDGYYYGVRRAPYSTDPNVNGFAFRHIGGNEELPTHPLYMRSVNNWEVHNAGEIWAAMLWDGYMALHTSGAQAGRSFDEVRRAMSDYIVTGMQLAPDNATLLQSRDGLLMAIAMLNPADVEVFAQAFADRGAGTCAVGPPIESQVLGGIDERYELQPRLAVPRYEVREDDDSCDGDGILDAGESGVAVVRIFNQGPVAMDNTEVVITSDNPALIIDDSVIAVPPVAAFDAAVIEVPIRVVSELDSASSAILAIEVTNQNSCLPVVSHTQVVSLNIDETMESSHIDSFDASLSVWSVASPVADVGYDWRRVADDTGSYWTAGLWLPRDDHEASLRSPLLRRDLTTPTVISFRHRYDMPDESTGGTLEVSFDGANWSDIASVSDIVYPGVVGDTDATGAYTGTSQSWPGFVEDQLTLDSSYDVESLYLRFTVRGSKWVEPIWDIEEIRIDGLANSPFPEVAIDDQICPPSAAVIAVPTQARPGDVVRLDASESRDFDDDALLFSWAQIAGPRVPLSSYDSQTTEFVAPRVSEDVSLVFTVTVSDDDTDTVAVAAVEIEADEAPMGCRGGPVGGWLVILCVFVMVRRT